MFAGTKNAVCRCYDMLSKHAVHRKYVGMFHASMAPTTKATRVVDFTSGTIRCLVSTVAFGMVCISYPNCLYMYLYVCSSSGHQGMDIKDVDLVIVYGAPSSVNQLHQVAMIWCVHVCS